MDEQCVLQAVAAYTQSLQRDVASCHNLSAAAKHARSTIQRRVRENRARHPRRILRETQTYRTAAQGMQVMFSQIGDVESANKLAGLIPMIQRDIEADKRAVAALDEDEQALQVAQHVVNDRGEDLEKGEQLFRLFFAQLNEQQGGGCNDPRSSGRSLAVVPLLAWAVLSSLLSRNMPKALVQVQVQVQVSARV